MHLYVYFIMTPNYFNAGLVRRGLANTLFAIIRSPDIPASLARFQIVTAVIALVPLTVLLRRLAAVDRRWWWFAVVLVLAPQLFLARAYDIGRVDMLTYAAIAVATIAAVDRRYVVATAAVAVGLLSHEGALFFGAALVTAIVLLDVREGSCTPRRAIVAAAAMVTFVAVVWVAQRLWGADGPTVARLILAAGPPSFTRDGAAFMTGSGLRSLTTSNCLSFHRPAIAVNFVAIYLIIAAYMVVFLVRSRAGVMLMAVATVVPFTAMSLAGVDYGRWLQIAVMSGWLFAVAVRLREPEPGAGDPAGLRHAIVAAAAILLLGPGLMFFATRVLEIGALHIWHGDANLMMPYLATCDPTWRSAIGL